MKPCVMRGNAEWIYVVIQRTVMGDIRNVGGSFLQYEKSFGRPTRRWWN